MSQSSKFHSSQQTFKKINNHHDYRSRVRDTARKFDLLGKSNDLSASPASSHQSSLAFKATDCHTNETYSSSISSSTDSISSEYIVNPSPKEQRKLSNAKHISTARIEIRPPTQHKPTPHQRRIPPPPVPQSPTKFKDDDDRIYVNNDHENHHFQEIDDENEIDEIEFFPSYSKPNVNRQELQKNENIRSRTRKESYRTLDEKPSRVQNRRKHSDVDSIGLEVIEPVAIPQRQVVIENRHTNDRRHNLRRVSSVNNNYEATEIPEQNGNSIPLSSHRLPPPPPPPPPPAFAKPFLQKQQISVVDEPQPYMPRRSLPLSNFMMELGALLVVFILCMILVLALKEDETKLRTTSQLVYTYIYLVSIIWMIWCTFDIIKFRRQWMDLTSEAHDHDEYMDITERHPHVMFYFPDIHNTGGLFMRIGAGLLCMGGLLLTVIELARTVIRIGNEEANRDTSATIYSSSVIITKIISYAFRFLFHCVQFTFLFRYGNLVINRYHLIARIGLIHLIIANFCTWFEAIVFETLEQMHKHPDTHVTTTEPHNVTYSTTTITSTTSFNDTNTTEALVEFIRGVAAAVPSGGSGSNKSTLAILNEIESTMGVYLYPCLIEYSLISLTVFFIMWRNVGKSEKRSFLRFGDRHVFTINCARASRGLLVGGIIFLLTIFSLIPTYVLEDDATSVTHITGFVLLIVSLFTVCLSYLHTTKLFYDHDAHVDEFDQVLILITTVGDFAYSFFGIFASIFVNESKSKLPSGFEISIGFLAIFQTFLQSGFIMDTLKRRTTTKHEHRNKPGRETITALLLMNLAIWMHDSLSAKKVRLNPSQVAYYDAGTWAIIQAFTSPLSIFYRFHSSVCLADIWQEVYQDDGTRLGGKNQMHRLISTNSAHENQH